MVKQTRSIADGTTNMRTLGIASASRARSTWHKQRYAVSYLRNDEWVHVGYFDAISQIKAIAQFSTQAAHTFTCDAVRALPCE